MATYTIGEFYEFTALQIFEDSNGIRYIALNDGSGVPQRVRPFDFQTEWADILGTKIRCYCYKIGMKGNPFFSQDYYKVLSDLYNAEGEVCVFTVTESGLDANNNKQYYQIQDVYGLVHRYYSNESFENQQEISLKVIGINKKDNNRAYLVLKPLEQESSVAKRDYELLRESKFGQENQEREFKSTIVFPAGSINADIKKQLGQICRSLAGFMNTEGGTLYIGVNDSGEVCGIEQDIPHLNDDEEDTYHYQLNCDGYEQKIRCTVTNLLGLIANSAIHFDFKKENAKIYCMITVDKVNKPIYYNDVFIFERQGNMTRMLKGESITYFMEKRLGIAQSSGVEEAITIPHHSDSSIGATIDKNTSIETPAVAPVAEDAEPTEFYISFYENGEWSYQKMIQESALWNVSVTKSQKKDKKTRLIQIYDNGCMNVVSLSDICSKTKGKTYKNGWNTAAKMINAFCADPHDQIVFFSKDEDDREWVKVHYVSCVECHTSMSTKGNIIINPKYDNAKPICVQLIQKQYSHLVSALCFRDNETSVTLGVKTKDKQYSAPVALLKILCNL